MKFADMQKGGTYYRFVENDSPEAMMAEPGQSFPPFILARYTVVSMGAVYARIARLSPKGRPYATTTYRRMREDWAPFYPGADRAKFALVTRLAKEIEDTQHKLKRLTEHWNTALLITFEENKP